MTADEIYEQMVEVFQKETGLTLSSGGDMAVRLYAVASQIYALYVQADWVNRQCFPQTAVEDYLDLHAQLRGLTRREAAAAAGVIRFETDSAAGTDLVVWQRKASSEIEPSTRAIVRRPAPSLRQQYDSVHV